MIRLIAVAALALAVATSVHALTLAPLYQSDGAQVRHAWVLITIRQMCANGT
jgi:hypothetical protein